MARTVQNFIDGESVDAADGRRADLIDPTHRRGLRLGAGVRRGGRRRGVRRGRRGVRDLARHHPRERQRALLKFADAMEERAEEIIAAECENTGKPIELTRSEEMPPAVDQLRFFAGAARVLEGRSAGEYMAGHTSYVRREPIGVVGQVTPWNYPMMMAVWKFAPGAGGRQHRRAQAAATPRRSSTVLLAEIAAEFLPPGVFNVVCGDRDTGRALVAHQTPAMVSITGSTRAGMRGRRGRGQGPQADAPGAGRQGAGDRLRRRRHRRRRRGDRGRPATSTPARTARRRPGCWPAPAVRRRLRRTRWPSRPAAPRPARADDEDVLYGPLNNANQLEPCRRPRRPAARPRLRCWPAAAGRASAATSTSRRWSTGLRQDDEQSRTRSSGRSSPCSRSPTRTRRCAGPTASSTGWPPRCGRATTAGRCGSRAGSTSAASGSTRHIPLVAEMPHGGFKHSGYGKDLSMYGLEDYTRIKHVMHNIDF